MKQRISEEAIQKMRSEFMNKRISFETMSGERWVGNCQFLGYNQFLPTWEFQITIDRTPCSHVRPETISLMPEAKKLFI